MSIDLTPVGPPNPSPSASEKWRRLGSNIRRITPSGAARFLLFLGVLAIIGWLIWYTWVVLTPFLVGAVIAYTVSPLVNRLERWLPRFLAILLALGLLSGLVLLFFALLAPIVAQQVYAIYVNLPGLEEVRGYGKSLDEYVATLPKPTQTMINNIYTQATTKAQANMDTYVSGLINLGITTILSLANTVGFILGFLVIPSWVLMTLQDQRRGSQAINRMLPNWLRGDFWGVVRIFDRAFGAFIRGQLLTGLIVAGLTFVGLKLTATAMGLPGAVNYILLLAMIAGMTQLIPSIGPFLGVIPAALVGLSISVQACLAVIIVYIVVQVIVAYFVLPQVEKSVANVHPALLVMIVVALSQFGLWWVLLATPVTAIVHNLYRYIYGRLGDPPRPAGLLPDDPLPVPPRTQPSAAIPLAYRRGRARLRPGLK